MEDTEKQDQQERDEAGESSQTEEGFEGLEDDHLYEDWDELATDPEEVSRLGRALEGLMPDIVKRGFDGLVKEDGIRSIVKERELPREAVGFLLGQVDATKREVLRIVSKEVRMFLQNVDLGGELTKILTSVSFEIKTEVRFIPNDAAVKPNIKNKVSVRGEKGDKETLVEDEGGPWDNDDEASSEDVEDHDATDEQAGGDDEGQAETDSDQPRRRRWSLRRRRDDADEDDASETGDRDQE